MDARTVIAALIPLSDKRSNNVVKRAVVVLDVTSEDLVSSTLCIVDYPPKDIFFCRVGGREGVGHRWAYHPTLWKSLPSLPWSTSCKSKLSTVKGGSWLGWYIGGPNYIQNDTAAYEGTVTRSRGTIAFKGEAGGLIKIYNRHWELWKTSFRAYDLTAALSSSVFSTYCLSGPLKVFQNQWNVVPRTAGRKRNANADRSWLSLRSQPQLLGLPLCHRQ